MLSHQGIYNKEAKVVHLEERDERMENPNSGLVPLGKIGMWIMLLEDGWSTKLIFARFTSMRIIFYGMWSWTMETT